MTDVDADKTPTATLTLFYQFDDPQMRILHYSEYTMSAACHGNKYHEIAMHKSRLTKLLNKNNDNSRDNKHLLRWKCP